MTQRMKKKPSFGPIISRRQRTGEGDGPPYTAFGVGPLLVHICRIIMFFFFFFPWINPTALVFIVPPLQALPWTQDNTNKHDIREVDGKEVLGEILVSCYPAYNIFHILKWLMVVHTPLFSDGCATLSRVHVKKVVGNVKTRLLLPNSS